MTSLWLTSRSAHELGTSHCAYARYLGYHAGNYGYGYQRRALSLPLVTGTYVDKPISAIAQWLIDATASTGQQPTHAPDEVIRWAARLAVKKYHETVTRRGILALAEVDAETNRETLDRLNWVINEQVTLIEGLVWTWCMLRLPALLREYRLIAVQSEEEFVIGCTCGLGDRIGTIADHESRDCRGVGELSRPDLLMQRFDDHTFCYTEIKTTSQAKRGWNATWEHKPQFLLGMLGSERRLNTEFSHARVEGIVKGRRTRDYVDRNDPTAIKKQETALCYAYLRLANPGLSLADWKPGFKYLDANGLSHQTPKDYYKTPIWIAPDDAFPGKPEGMSRVEWWIRYLNTNFRYALEKCLNPIGPIPRQRGMIEQALRSSLAEESIWRHRVWTIYQYATATGQTWADPEYRRFVEQVIPRSWNCDPYGPDHPCQFQPICFESDGHDQPVESRLYVYRSPHHALEAEQMKARGLEPPEGVGYDPDEDDEGDWSE